MLQVTLLNREGQPEGATVQGLEAQDLLLAAGVECGRWASRLGAVSSVPQLSYARELLTLQRRFDYVTMRRSRVAAGHSWGEPLAAHVHDELELRVVVHGVLRLWLAARAQGGWLQADLPACMWVAVPAQLPHAAAPHAQHGVDLLCLYTRPEGCKVLPVEGLALPVVAQGAKGRHGVQVHKGRHRPAPAPLAA